ncbi:MAG: FtsX-like permease family protein [Bacteroidota bacterium]
MFFSYFIASRLNPAGQQGLGRMAHRIGMVSVSLALAVSLCACLVMQGFEQDITQKLTGFHGQLQIRKYTLARSYEELPVRAHQAQGLQEAFAQEINTIEPFAQQSILLRTAEAIEGVVCKGVDTGLSHQRLEPYLVDGRLMAPTYTQDSYEIVISHKIAHKLRLAVGDVVMACGVQQPMQYQTLQVVGIYNTYVEDLDEKCILCDLRFIQDLNGWPDTWVGGFDISLHDATMPTQQLIAQLQDSLDYDLILQRTADTYAALFDWLHIMHKDVMIFLTLILLVASANIASAVMIQTMERTHLLGTLQALGATRGQISRVMLGMHRDLVGKGMLWGNLIALGLAAVQSKYKMVRLDPDYYYVTHLPIAWHLKTLVCINAVVALLVALVLLLSIRLILKIRPIQAIQWR